MHLNDGSEFSSDEAGPPLPLRRIQAVAESLAQCWMPLPTGVQEQDWQRAAQRVVQSQNAWLLRVIRAVQPLVAKSDEPWTLEVWVQQLLHNPAVLAGFRQVPPTLQPKRIGFVPYHASLRAAPFALLKPLPRWETLGALAVALDLTPEALDWYANARGTNPLRGPLAHYHLKVIAKRRGGWRLLEAPKPHLAAVQQKILREVLNAIPVHPAAHGGVTGCSVVTHAQQHCHRPWILKLDLADFFPSIGLGPVQGIFRTVGFPDPVATCLAQLTTHRVPPEFLNRPAFWGKAGEFFSGSQEQKTVWRRTFEPYTGAHLPQGAPTSPRLANLCAWSMDCRLSALARRCGLVYSRYVDDLAFSPVQAEGSEWSAAQRRGFLALVTRIVIRSGFALNVRKTAWLGRAQRQVLTGVTVNSHPNWPRPDYEAFKALLHNCRRWGPQSQNRAGHFRFREHLQGRLAYLAQIHPQRAEKLRSIFGQIDWGPENPA